MSGFRKKSTIILSFFFLFLIATVSHAVLKSDNKVHAHLMEQNECGVGFIELGNGFAQYNNEIKPTTAITNMVVQTSAPVGSIQLHQVNSLDAFRSEIGVYGSAQIPIHGASIKSLSSFMHSYRNDNLDMSLLYTAEWQYVQHGVPAINGHPFSLSPKVLKLYKKSPRAFLDSFGNTFITKVNVGSALYLMLNIHFVSSDVKTDFQNKLGAGVENIASVSTALSAMVNHGSVQGSIDILALQFGGKPARLGEIFKGISDDGDVSSDASYGEKATGFNFANMQHIQQMVKNTMAYLKDIPNQVSLNKPETLFSFGKIEFQPYSSIDPSISPAQNGLFSDETIKARNDIKLGYATMQKLDSIKIPFWVVKHYKSFLGIDDERTLTSMLSYRKALHDYFQGGHDSVEFLCFRGGFEKLLCHQAAMELKKLTPRTIEEKKIVLKQMNFSIDFGGQYTLYPVSSTKKEKDKVFIQRFVALDRWGHSSEVTLKMNSTTPLKMEDYPRGFYDLITSFQVKQISYSSNNSEIAEPYQWQVMIKSGQRVFIDKTRNIKVNFIDSFYTPYPEGVICLHLTATAWFTATITNETTGEDHSIIIFQNTGIKAGIGDIVSVKALGSPFSPHEFIVTKPFDTGFSNGMPKIPINSTINFWGTIFKQGVSFLLNESDCIS